MSSKEAIVRVCLSIRSALAELEFVSLANAGSGGYNAVQNRSLLCNALISALEIARAASPDGTPDISDSVASDRLPVALHAELLAFFVLLHADEAQTMLTELAMAPAAVCSHDAVTRALRVAGCFAREDAVGWRRAVSCCTLLEVACVIRLLPRVRAFALQQANAAYTPREAVPLSALCKWLLLGETSDAERCAAAHGVKREPEDSPAHVRVKSASFSAAPPAQPYEPPLGPPTVPPVQRWLQRQQSAAERETNAPSAAAPLTDEARQARKAKRRPPPKSLLLDDKGEQPAGAEAKEADAKEVKEDPAHGGLSLRDFTFRMLREGEEDGLSP